MWRALPDLREIISCARFAARRMNDEQAQAWSEGTGVARFYQ
jgi:hypothetical protein